MTLEISRRARALLNQINIKAQIILEIDGLPNIYGAVDVTKFVHIGEDNLTIGEFIIGGVIKKDKARAYISLRGTTTSINQQVLPDKEGTTSVQTISINMIDKNGELTKDFSPGQIVSDLLGRKTRIFIGFQNGSHPEDSIVILNGIITSQSHGPGNVKLIVAAPEDLKRQEILQFIETELSADIDNVVTTIPIKSTAGMFLPEDILNPHININDEVIKYTGISGDDLTGCVRGQFGTIAVSHEIDDPVETRYVLEESALIMALKILLSSPVKAFVSNIAIKSFVFVESGLEVPNAVVFSESNIQERFGLTVGDKITITLASKSANNVIEKSIASFATFSGGSYIVLSSVTLELETDTNAVCDFISQYNVMQQDGVGCKMSPEQVDVARFQLWDDLFGNNLPVYRFLFFDTVKAKEFIDKDIFFPASMYPLPRKGRTSVNITIPPLALEDAVILDKSNVRRASTIHIERSTNKFFYNVIIMKYDEKVTKAGKFLTADVFVSEDSFNRIKNVGRRPLTIEARGFRTDIDATKKVSIQTGRLLERYRFAPEIIKNLRVLYKTGFTIEIGDVVILKGAGLKISDLSRGDRDFRPRLMEVINKKLDYKTGDISLNLLDTRFGLDRRIGIMAPSSFLASGSTTSKLKLKRSFGTKETEIERDKWAKYIGEKVVVKSQDLVNVQEVTLKAFVAAEEDAVIIDPILSFTPLEGFVLDAPDYSGDADTKVIWKNLHCFVCPTVDVASGIDDQNFTVTSGDIGKFFVNGFIKVHNLDFSDNSSRVKITNIAGLQITVDKTLGFTPGVGYKIQAIGFASDEGLPYNYL